MTLFDKVMKRIEKDVEAGFIKSGRAYTRVDVTTARDEYARKLRGIDMLQRISNVLDEDDTPHAIGDDEFNMADFS